MAQRKKKRSNPIFAFSSLLRSDPDRQLSQTRITIPRKPFSFLLRSMSTIFSFFFFFFFFLIFHYLFVFFSLRFFSSTNIANKFVLCEEFPLFLFSLIYLLIILYFSSSGFLLFFFSFSFLISIFYLNPSLATRSHLIR